jgi:hypothetical protein
MNSNFQLSLEEQRIIDSDLIYAESNAEAIDTTFMDMLNIYLDANYANPPLRCINVPGDGSCFYHSVLLSYQSKFEGFQLELNDREMRKRVSIFLLQHMMDDNHLERFGNFKPAILPPGTEESTQQLRNRYIQYFQQHKNDTSQWPIELCIETVTKIYGFAIIVLGETKLNGIQSNLIEKVFESIPTTNKEYTTIVIGNRWNFHYYGIG